MTNIKLHEHQSEWMQKVLNSEPGDLHLLTAPPGTGKSTTLRALAAESLSDRTTEGMTLVVVPSLALAGWMRELIERQGGIVRQVSNRKQLRKLEVDQRRAVTNPVDCVILGATILENADSRHALAGFLWGVIVMDDLGPETFPSISSADAEWVETLVDELDFRVLAIAARAESTLTEKIDFDTHTEWGYPLSQESLPGSWQSIEVQFSRSEEECEILSMLQEIVVGVESKTLEKALKQRIASSLYAFEQTIVNLISIRNLLMHDVRRAEDRLRHLTEPWPEQVVERLPGHSDLLRDLFDATQSVKSDTKLLALKEELSQRDGAKKIVVFTDYVDTAQYLGENLHGALLLSAGLSDTDKSSRVEDFESRREGLLIATTTGLRGFEFEADVIVHYDIPLDEDLNSITHYARLSRVHPRNEQSGWEWWFVDTNCPQLPKLM